MLLRGVVAIVRATALEILSEPLSLLVLIAALTLSVFAPAFHYHQFGEATRMARDAGFSALFTCGSVWAVFTTIRAFRREVESGTLEMALAHPISRTVFFLSKTAGAAVAYLVFAVCVLGVQLTIVWGAAVGGAIAARTGDIARVFGPALAVGVSIILVPLAVGAVLNRFARGRFVFSAIVTAGVCSLVAGGAALALSRGFFLRLLPVAVLLTCPAMVLLASAAAFSSVWRANAAASLTGVVFLVMLPAIGNYYMSEALANGGEVSWAYVALAALAALPAISAILCVGVRLFNRDSK